MKKYLLPCLMYFLFSGISFAKAPAEIVFFGDSLSDNGNIYLLDMHLLPKSPPYYTGRFSNGPTWAEHLGRYYHERYRTHYSDYACGGATAASYNPFVEKSLPISLTLELDRYLLDSLFLDRSQTLFVIWIGGNDYLFDNTRKAEAVTDGAIEAITQSIRTLIAHHGRQFLILSLPDVGKTPYATATDEGDSAWLHLLSVTHNQKLRSAIDSLQKQFPEITLIYEDIGFIFDDLQNHPEKYNQKYQVNISDTRHACWPGGYTLRNALRKGVLQDLPQNPAFRQTVLESPDLFEAWSVSQLARTHYSPCANPDSFVFWDKIHPTAVTHRVLAEKVKEDLAAAGLGD